MSWKDMPQPTAPEQLEHGGEADLIVVGLGYAGVAATRAAAEKGVRVIGLEQQNRERQNVYGRDIGHINSAFLKKRGIPPVDPIDLFNEWMRRAGNRANPSLVMKFCQNSGAAFDWFTNMYTEEELQALHIAFWPEGGEQYREALRKGKIDINGYHYWYGTAQFPDPMGWTGKPTLQDCHKANVAKAEEAGAQLFFQQEAVELMSDEHGVTGVVTKDLQGVRRAYHARNGVILAAGDFSGDREMVRDLCVDLPDLMTPDESALIGFGRKGSGIKLGVWAGGRLETRPLPTMGGNSINFMGPATFGSVWLDSKGRRYCNEVFGGTELRGFPGNQIGRGDLYLVFDEHILENELQWAFPCHGNVDVNGPGVIDGLNQIIAGGKAGNTHINISVTPPLRGDITFWAGTTPEELANNASLTGALRANVIQSIKRYNEICARGRDDDFGRDPKLLDPLTDTLFLQKVRPNMMFQMLVTVGGLVTDECQQVLDQNFQRIPGLYATGNCCGRRFGTQYTTPLSGVSIGIALTLGRQLGLELAARSA